MKAEFVPQDTKAALQPLPVRDCSRSLYFDRYSRPDLAKDERQQFFTDGFDAHRSAARAASWAVALQRMPADVRYAQLQSRLLVNMAGGVMENAGLCLDRFGLPYIPGSAVKGCARRAALAAMHEWCETGQKPGATEQDNDNLFKPACADFATPAAMLTAIARVFGWGEQDWKTRDDFRNDDEWAKKRSDFAWACADRWETTRAETLGLPGSAPASGVRAPRVKDFAGSVSFLPAYPVDLPANAQVGDLPVAPLGKLELDVVTCHHRDYYANIDPQAVARDVEEPVPVVFPAVAAGHVFAFAIVRLRGGEIGLVGHARAWLACGLSTFGLGAKTNAGYGWFADVTVKIREAEAAERQRQAKADRQAQEQAAVENARARLQPDPALIEKLRAMKEADLRGQINPFATEARFWSQKDERVQLTLLHFLTATAPELFAADRANSNSKVAKALASLSAKFPQLA